MAYTRAHALLFLAPLLLIVLLMYGMMAWTVAVSMDDWVGMAPSGSSTASGISGRSWAVRCGNGCSPASGII